MHKSCCVIVGAGPGLGLSLARKFAQCGFDIAMISRNHSKLESLAEALNSEGHTTKGFVADAAIEKELNSAFSLITNWNKDIEVLIYNAAAIIPDNVLDMTTSSMMDKMILNLGGAICSVNYVLPPMRGRGGGTILIALR